MFNQPHAACALTLKWYTSPFMLCDQIHIIRLELRETLCVDAYSNFMNFFAFQAFSILKAMKIIAFICLIIIIDS